MSDLVSVFVDTLIGAFAVLVAMFATLIVFGVVVSAAFALGHLLGIG